MPRGELPYAKAYEVPFRKKEHCIEAAVASLLLVGGIAALVQNASSPADRDELKISAAGLRTLCSTARLQLLGFKKGDPFRATVEFCEKVGPGRVIVRSTVT